MTKLLTIAVAAMIALPAAAPAFASGKSLPGISAGDDGSVIDKRRKPRVPGGSGCDDPRDLIEHPECRG
ncbi:MAG: hypothetical protein F9K34_09215 [Albidovulum sp.]|jgi:hypothetical protein|uniref:hypothetical protein n=1 Tax=Albidovulum sp. TaxID=1872424 RepID=UPI00132A0D76|nr:hypothetical protein [Defluviimonas sp.]KAB2884303.1 MAG: hypothetical protein F9K34_09215 [Defluviimonas sp.]